MVAHIPRLRVLRVYHLRATRGCSDDRCATIALAQDVLPALVRHAPSLHCFALSSDFELEKIGAEWRWRGDVVFVHDDSSNDGEEASAATSEEQGSDAGETDSGYTSESDWDYTRFLPPSEAC